MKRSGPPSRRTPMRRTGISRGDSRMRRTRLSPVSDKRAGESDERFEVRSAAWHRAGGRCEAEHIVPEVQCAGPMDVDEIVPRGVRPGGHLDIDNVQLVCRAHHDWKHANPAEAQARGLRRWSWQK